MKNSFKGESVGTFLGASLIYRTGVVDEVVLTIFSSPNAILCVLPVDDE